MLITVATVKNRTLDSIYLIFKKDGDNYKYLDRKLKEYSGYNFTSMVWDVL